MEHTRRDLKGKTVLVTGASGGIGAAVSQTIARTGAHVLLHYNKNETAASALAAALERAGGSVETIQADLTDDAQLESLCSRILSHHGSIDIVVNNAGAIERPSGWLEQSPSRIRAAIETNFTAHFLLTRLLAPSMIKKGYGRIVNISSTYGMTGSSQVLAYTCAKAALITLTYSLARELGAHGITVNCVAPGNIDTAMTNSAPQAVLDWVRSTTPVGRLGQPDEVADAVMYLLFSPFVTGTVLVVDGGQLLNM
jgi:NAD(P)-dependent dehydrogenase (short-subunit alcohol dehydrogenase family)